MTPQELREREIEVQRALARPQTPEDTARLRAELSSITEDLYGDSSLGEDEAWGFPCIC